MLRHRRPCGGVIRIKTVGLTKVVRVSCGGCGWNSVNKLDVRRARSKGGVREIDSLGRVTTWFETESGDGT